jgi:hypothetical protein
MPRGEAKPTEKQGGTGPSHAVDALEDVIGFRDQLRVRHIRGHGGPSPSERARGSAEGGRCWNRPFRQDFHYRRDMPLLQPRRGGRMDMLVGTGERLQFGADGGFVRVRGAREHNLHRPNWLPRFPNYSIAACQRHRAAFGTTLSAMRRLRVSLCRKRTVIMVRQFRPRPRRSRAAPPRDEARPFALPDHRSSPWFDR